MRNDKDPNLRSPHPSNEEQLANVLTKAAVGKGVPPPDDTPETPEIREDKLANALADAAAVGKGVPPPEEPPKTPDPRKKGKDGKTIPDLKPEGDDKRISTFDFGSWLLKRYKFGKVENVLYVFDRFSFIYLPMTFPQFNLWIRSKVHSGEIPKSVKKCINRYYLSELLDWVTADPNIPELPERPNPRYIAAANGLLDLKQHKLIDFADIKPDDLPVIYNRLPVKYINYDVSEWHSSPPYKYFERLSYQDCRDSCMAHLQYMFGKASSNDREGKTLEYICGPKDSGKSVCADMLQYMLGKNNCAFCSVTSLPQQFTKINLFHKLANICADEDISAWTVPIATDVKKITSGDTISADVKFSSTVDFKPYSMLICFANDAPVYSRRIDAGGAVSERLNLIPTGPTVKNKDPELFHSKILPKLDLVFSACVDFYLTHDAPEKIVTLDDIISPGISQDAMFERWRQQCVSETEDCIILKVGDDFWPNYLNFVQNAPYSSRLSRKQFEMKLAITFSDRKTEKDDVSAYNGLILKDNVYKPKKSDFGEW